MKKALLFGGGGLVLIVIVLIALAIMNLGSIIKTATETYGPQFTQTEVKLGSADISILSGSGELEDFLLGNPEGFTMPSALECGTIRIKVVTDSLTSDRIIIEEIFVDSPTISYEKKGRTDNFQAIVANIKRAVAGEKSGAKQQPADGGQADDSGPGKTIQINHFIVRNGKINLGGSLLSAFGDGGVGIALPDIHLRDIGKDKETSPAEAFALILGELTGDVTGTVSQVGKQLQEGVGKALEGVKGGAESVGDAVKGLFGD